MGCCAPKWLPRAVQALARAGDGFAAAAVNAGWRKADEMSLGEAAAIRAAVDAEERRERGCERAEKDRPEKGRPEKVDFEGMDEWGIFAMLGGWLEDRWRPQVNQSDLAAFINSSKPGRWSELQRAISLRDAARKLPPTALSILESFCTVLSEECNKKATALVGPLLFGGKQVVAFGVEGEEDRKGAAEAETAIKELVRWGNVVFVGNCGESSCWGKSGQESTGSVSEESWHGSGEEERIRKLEREVEKLRREIKRVKRDGERRNKELATTFDFWAKLVLSELHSQSAAGAAARRELGTRINAVENYSLQQGFQNGGVTKKTRQKMGAGGNIHGYERANVTAKGSQAIRAVDRDQKRIRFYNSVNKNNTDTHGSNDTSNMDDDDDRELMQAFKRALGSHFSPDAPCGDVHPRVFRDGRWIDGRAVQW